ncbi:MAG: hypothetical protein AAF432_16440, partial [Planctomycetota bacterium]
MIRSILTLVALAGFCLVMTGCGGGSSTDADGTTAEDRAADRGELRGLYAVVHVSGRHDAPRFLQVFGNGRSLFCPVAGCWQRV